MEGSSLCSEFLCQYGVHLSPPLIALLWINHCINSGPSYCIAYHINQTSSIIDSPSDEPTAAFLF